MDVVKVKADNETRHNMPSNSPIYNFLPRQLESLMVKYPDEFPNQLSEEIRGRMRMYRNSSSLYSSLTFGGIFYFLLCKRRPWFQLTGNATVRLTLVCLGISSMMDINYVENDYMLKQVFTNNRAFENVVWKHGVNPDLRGPFQLLTD